MSGDPEFIGGMGEGNWRGSWLDWLGFFGFEKNILKLETCFFLEGLVVDYYILYGISIKIEGLVVAMSFLLVLYFDVVNCSHWV